MTTIRHRLMFSLLAGRALLLAGGERAAYALTRAALTRQFDAALRAKAMALAALTEQDHGRVELELDGQFMPEFDTNTATAFFQL